MRRPSKDIEIDVDQDATVTNIRKQRDVLQRINWARLEITQYNGEKQEADTKIDGKKKEIELLEKELQYLRKQS